MKKTLLILLLVFMSLWAKNGISATPITIDAAWITSQGPPPYPLDQANTTYSLAMDISVENSAFLVLEENIILDLNNHTVTYNQCTPVVVDNGSFETGSGTSVPSWDLSSAPSAAIATNTTYLFGSQVLRFTNINTTETIISDPISLLRTDHTYVAVITPGNRADYRTQLTLKVVDHITNTILAYGVSNNVERGFSAVAEFRPQTTHPIRLEIEIDPQIATTLDLDDARVVSAYDSGIIAAQQWSGDIPAMSNFDPALTVIYNSARSGIENFTLQNGTVTQGNGTGYKSSPLEFGGIHGLLVENITLNANGPDTTTLRAPALACLAGTSTLDAIVRNCTLNHTIDLVANRMHGPSVIALSGDCNILIENNTLRDGPQSGINGGNSEDHTYIVRNNDIRNTAVALNAYAIGLAGIQNFDIHDNTIITTHGRGICIDGYTAAATENGRIYNNHVAVQELGNRETLDIVTARALRIRNNVDAMGPHRNLHIYDNTFIATTASGQGQSAYGGRVSWTNQNNQMNNANLLIENNTFKAVAYAVTHTAKAFVLDGAAQNINALLRNNVFESNHISLKILDSDGGDTYDTDFISNTIRRSTEGAVMAYQSIEIGYWIYAAHDIRLIDTQYDSAATSVAWSGSGLKNIPTGWLLNLLVADQSALPLSQAIINITDSSSAIVYTGSTDENGQAAIPLASLIYSQTGSDPQIIETESRNPFQITVDRPGYLTSVMSLALDQTLSRSIVLAQDPAIVYSQQMENNEVIVFPIPAQNQVHFLFAANLSGTATIHIYNMLGETVARLSGTLFGLQPEIIWNAASLSPGIYIFTISHNNKLLKKGKLSLIH
ncbi:T9SS type A sorting domain-containing protein [bacterium]|nr:T9SS type A sorting domain-containing protein [bacterium]